MHGGQSTLTLLLLLTPVLAFTSSITQPVQKAPPSIASTDRTTELTQEVSKGLAVDANTVSRDRTLSESDTQLSEFKIVFEENGEINLSYPQLKQFLHCLCDNSSKDCIMFTSGSKDMVASNSATQSYTVMEVRQGVRAQDNDDADLQNITSMYTCGFFPSSLLGVLYCADQKNATYRLGESSSKVAQQPTNFYTTCDFENVTLKWTDGVKSFNFGQGPITVKDNEMSLSFSHGIGFASEDVKIEKDLDVRNENDKVDNFIHNGNRYDDTSRNQSTKTYGNIKQIDGKEKKEQHSNWYAPTVFGNQKLFIVLFSLSLVINVILLVLCIYLYIDKRRKTDIGLSNLPPVFFSEQGDSVKQSSFRTSEPKDSLNTSYQDIDSEDIRDIKLKASDDGGYLAPIQLQVFQAKEGENRSSDVPIAGCSGDTTTRSVQDFEDVNLSDTEQKPANYRSITQEEHSRASHTYTNWSENFLRPKDNAVEIDIDAENTNKKSSPRSGITKRKEILSAFFKSTFNRITYGADKYRAHPDDTPPSDVTSETMRARVSKNKPAPRKPRRSRENIPRLTNDTSEYRRKSKRIAAQQNEPEERCHNNPAFSSVESDESVCTIVKDRTSSIYCNL